MRVTLPLRGYHGQFGAHPGQWRKKKWQEGSPIVVPKNVTFNDPRLQVAVEQSGKYVENPFWNPPWERPKVRMAIISLIMLNAELLIVFIVFDIHT